ncbi:MAG: TraB/GumN family protein [bacterium]|nr:TraB/GumN family protein [bacterium]
MPDHGYPPEVRKLELGGRQFILVGTAHVSKTSVELVRRVIEREQPDCVCVELDSQRYEALSKKKQWEDLDIKQVIRKKQFATLMVNLLLAAYQKRLGGYLGVQPGEELLEATRVAREHEIPIALCDRDVRVTLRRAIHATSWFRRLLLAAELLATMFDSPELSEEQIQELKQQDVLNELMNELGKQLPALKRVLIDERDAYLCQRMKQARGERLVAVVGAGHLQGICDALPAERAVDLEALDEVPPISRIWKIVGWTVPAAILGAIVWIGWTQGAAEAGDNALYWILANAIPSALGAVAALAHPLTILAAFVGAPITSLTPVIGAGYVCIFVQVLVCPPVVKEFHSIGDDVGKLRRWWQSKLLRLFLVFILTGVGSMIGSFVGAYEIISNLF